MPQNRIKSGDINPLINPLNFQQILKAALELNQQLEEVLREKSRASQEAEANVAESLLHRAEKNLGSMGSHG
jgi:hypothetical protein